jgi:hypothetical protein
VALKARERRKAGRSVPVRAASRLSHFEARFCDARGGLPLAFLTRADVTCAGMAKETMLYYYSGRDPHGVPIPLHSYLVRAESWDDPPGAGIATIVALANKPRFEKQHVVQHGGGDAALASAEAHLDKVHSGLKKIRGR